MGRESRRNKLRRQEQADPCVKITEITPSNMEEAFKPFLQALEWYYEDAECEEAGNVSAVSFFLIEDGKKIYPIEAELVVRAAAGEAFACEALDCLNEIRRTKKAGVS